MRYLLIAVLLSVGCKNQTQKKADENRKAITEEAMATTVHLDASERGYWLDVFGACIMSGGSPSYYCTQYADEAIVAFRERTR